VSQVTGRVASAAHDEATSLAGCEFRIVSVRSRMYGARSELEGARSTDAARVDQDAYFPPGGDIDQLGERVPTRYGLA
jgi:hypothetical protein